MILGRLAALGLALVAASGVAWGQRPESGSASPSSLKYDDALKAVSNAGCERKEVETYVQFVCEKAGAIWYFTREGRPEHPAYRAMPAYRVVPPRGTVPMDGRGFAPLNNSISWAESADREAWTKWVQQIFRVWAESTPAVWPDPAEKPRAKPRSTPPS